MKWPAALLLSMTLGREQQIVRPDGRTENVRPDHFTRLLIKTDLSGNGNPDTAIEDALAAMKRSHCAIQAIASIIEHGGVKSVSFGETYDGNGEYDPDRAAITINKDRGYLYNPENLAKGLYHEGLHHVEFKLGLRRRGESSTYHDSTRIRVILVALLGKNSPCLGLVRNDGRLLNQDGSFYEPDYDKAETGPPHIEPPKPSPINDKDRIEIPPEK